MFTQLPIDKYHHYQVFNSLTVLTRIKPMTSIFYPRGGATEGSFLQIDMFVNTSETIDRHY